MMGHQLAFKHNWNWTEVNWVSMDGLWRPWAKKKRHKSMEVGRNLHVFDRHALDRRPKKSDDWKISCF